MSRLVIPVYILLNLSAAWSQGYHLEPDRVMVEGTDWQGWSILEGALRFTPEGVQPQYVRSQSNAVLDAKDFGDHEDCPCTAGTDEAHLANLADGREDTFWEPSPEVPLEDWWVEIDLGRLVWAQQITVKFVAADNQISALKFKVRTSTGTPVSGGGTTYEYLNAGTSTEAYQIPSGFVFELNPALSADAGLAGDVIRLVQLVFTDRDDGQTEEVSQAQWHSLPAEERGAVLYFRRQASGVLQQVDRAAYEAIADSARRGPIRYYRRYRVRVAEVEVWTSGDNLSLGVLRRKGSIGGGDVVFAGGGDVESAIQAIDGDYTTFWLVQAFVGNLVQEQDYELERHLSFDLGGWYWMNRVLLVFDKAPFSSYVINLSDGRQETDGNLLYAPAVRRGQGNTYGKELNNLVALQDNSFPLTKARYLRMDYLVRPHSMVSYTGIKEIQVYGTGFSPQVSLISGMIEFGQTARTLSTIAWEAETPPGTQLQVRTRTGDQMVPQLHYFNKNGGEVTRTEYHKLVSFLRGDSLTTMVPGPDWSNWSEVYPVSGSTITSPSPRHYAMVEATLLSDDPNQAVLLRRLSIQLKTILASQVVGEISPGKLLQNGQRQTFALYLRPTLQAGDQGFDQVLVSLPPEAGAELMGVQVGSERELAAGEGKRYGPEALQRVASGPDSLWIRLPELVRSGQELIALRFSAVLYQASTPFVTSVGLDTGGETAWQRVDAGETTALGDGHDLTVFTPFEPEFLGPVTVSPNPFTPNGDGINDQVVFTVPVFKVLGDKLLVLEVYSLDGRLVRRVEQWASPAVGVHQLAWDGRDQERRLAPPGLYLCRVGLSVEARNVDQPQVTRTVASVY